VFTSPTNDFGLRAVKGIIALAERLKQQYLKILTSDIPFMLDNYSKGELPSRKDGGSMFDPEMTMIFKFIEERKLQHDRGDTIFDHARSKDALVSPMKISDGGEVSEGPMVKGHDVKTLLELYSLNEQKRRGRLAGTRSQVFEDVMGGRENLLEIGMELLMA
jgi:hypothetical protein